VPEGDTVFLAGQRLTEALAGKVLRRAELRHPELSTAQLAGRTVLVVATVGKHLFTRLDDGTSLHSHFRMDGSWHLYRPGASWHGGPGHTIRAVLAVDDRVAVGYRLHDLALLPTDREDELVGHLGPDLLGPDWDEAAEAEAVRRLTADGGREIGLALEDQRTMAGVGNMYKAEVCFLLGASPWTPVSEVDAGRAVRLSRKLLLRNAWRPEQNTTGQLGRDREHWVYLRSGKPCLRCGTPIRGGSQGTGVRARGTWWCPGCQPGPHP
jgi:endonuclease VIII